eukprot:TRINITY_DN23_c0_g1_i1.p1 TRINITY_DN23_c0_g1~~TRINITY_DN23_c0_g1_i1.p1  ORF type:complete len:853 (-),score=298.88 TRINITY_DN23_c0_g1_i1:256-2814(-)
MVRAQYVAVLALALLACSVVSAEEIADSNVRKVTLVDTADAVGSGSTTTGSGATGSGTDGGSGATGSGTDGTGSSDAHKIPFPKGTYEWWNHKVENNVYTVPNDSFVGLNECQCKCHVDNPDAADPFKCSCECPEHPKGQKGQKGQKGEIGNTGPRGLEGLRGRKGSRGNKGQKGSLGLKGVKGVTGIQGLKGHKGRVAKSITGPKGDKGDLGAQDRGAKGPRGPVGPRGPKGPKGHRGPDTPGDRGDKGVRGGRGGRGKKGPSGDRGYKGFQGVRGPLGPSGPSTFKWDPYSLTGQASALAICQKTLKEGYYTAVIRSIRDKRNCDQICASVDKSKCTGAYTHYHHRGVLAPFRLGQTSYVHKDCKSGKPNYCCCHSKKAFSGNSCPRWNGKECNGQGKCGGAAKHYKCVCNGAYTGYACKDRRYASHCHWVGDPHWATFDHRYSGSGTRYNLYEPGEFLEYYMSDPDINPDREAIVSYQQRPFRHSIVTANVWIAFRKRNDFVKIVSQGAIYIGHAPGCYGGNLAGHIKSKGGAGIVTKDGLRVRYNRNHWEVQSNVAGKNPTQTQLHVYGNWLYMNAYVHINTARTGKAVGVCGNFDGNGNDFPYWRYGEVHPNIFNKLRIPSSRSFNHCRKPMTTFSAVDEEIKSTFLEQAEMMKKNKSWKPTLKALVGVSHDPTAKGGAEGTMPALNGETLQEATATIKNGPGTTNDEDEADDQGGEDSVKASLNKCGTKEFQVKSERWAYLEKPWTWERVALHDCFRKIMLRKTPLFKESDEAKKKYQATVEGAQEAVDSLDKYGDKYDENVDDYLDCIEDICTTGRTENWQPIIKADQKLTEEEDEENKEEGHKH